MSKLEWQGAIDLVQEHVVKITTPQGSGTGVLISYGPGGSVCSIATAAHVIDHAHWWEQPIRIQHFSSGQSVLLRTADRAIFLDEELDTAAVVFNKAAIPFPVQPLSLIDVGMRLRLGIEMGWVGFPAISLQNLCFFAGRVSCWIESDGAYLVDGVAINGVSGGPAFYLDEESGTLVVGVVSAYIPNRATGETLPGLCVVRDVKQLQRVVGYLKSLGEAKKKETLPATPPPPNPEGGLDIS